MTQTISSAKLKRVQNNDCKVSLKGILTFEIKSLLGKIFLNSKPKRKSFDSNFLNLGCGSSKFENWVNADFFVFRTLDRPDWMLDLRFPLNCNDNYWDGVFSEHTLEHLYPDQAARLLKEIYRTMKPGAWLRLTVPDLKKYIDYYCDQEKHTKSKFNRWSTGCEAIRSLTQDHFHLSLWDAEIAEKYLVEVGFCNIKEVPFMKGSNVSLLKDGSDRSWETIYMEAQKPY